MATAYFILKALKRKRISVKINEQVSSNGKLSCFDLNDKCRVCLLKGSIIFSKNASLLESLKFFGGIEIFENDNYPKYLCNSCHSLLQSAILFRKQAQETNSKLIKLLECSVPLLLKNKNTSENSCNRYESSNEILNKIYECKSCKLKFSNWNKFISHKNLKHRNIRIQCTICHKILTPLLYKRHLARHQTASHIICDVCGKLYRKDNLARHLQLHSYNLPYKCQICPYRGRFLESLKLHMHTHTGVKPFACGNCPLQFLTRSNLNRHQLTHNKIKPHKCVECSKSFYTKRELNMHFKSDHAGIKDFECNTCGNKYGTKKTLMRHEIRVHKRDKMAKGRTPLYLQTEYKM